MFNHSKKILSFMSLCLLMILGYQNCSDSTFQAQDRDNLSSAFGTDIEIDIADDHSVHKQHRARAEAQALYSNRMLMYNTFIDVFGSSKKGDFIKNIAWASSEMGSGWNTYEKRLLSNSDCSKKRSALYRCDNFNLEAKASGIVGASATREGRRMSACHLGVETDSTFEYALKRIDENSSISSPPQPNDENFQRVFELFFRGKPSPGVQFFDALNIAHRKGADNKEGWKFVLLSICLSPHWQVM